MKTCIMCIISSFFSWFDDVSEKLDWICLFINPMLKKLLLAKPIFGTPWDITWRTLGSLHPPKWGPSKWLYNSPLIVPYFLEGGGIWGESSLRFSWIWSFHRLKGLRFLNEVIYIYIYWKNIYIYVFCCVAKVVLLQFHQGFFIFLTPKMIFGRNPLRLRDVAFNLPIVKHRKVSWGYPSQIWWKGWQMR